MRDELYKALLYRDVGLCLEMKHEFVGVVIQELLLNVGKKAFCCGMRILFNVFNVFWIVVEILVDELGLHFL